MHKQVKSHWFHVIQHYLLDAALFTLAFLFGSYIRFANEWSTGASTTFWHGYFPAVLAGALTLSSAAYIFGLYSRYPTPSTRGKKFFLLFAAFHIAMVITVCVGYLNWSARIGRGVMAAGYITAAATCLIHHLLIVLRQKASRERVAFIVNSPFDETEAAVFKEINNKHLRHVGIIAGPDYTPKNRSDLLGTITEAPTLIRKHKISRILCAGQSVNDARMRQAFCKLRYSGVRVSSLLSLCEEYYQFVPLELVTPEWLLSASDLPQIFYIRKLKRAFDVIVSVFGLIFLGPIALMGALAVRLTSDGPVLYRQTRTGRFGATFDVLKLRSMKTDAEQDGAQWSSENDPRVTRVGKFLRRYRIDEIPQLLNVLRGDMSFVGPRPERPEFIETLSEEIPYYQERLLVQPGITGWAQVRYPYGESSDDARRKLEYDLYYAKHMSVFLDIFILFDTVRIILTGGKRKSDQIVHPVTYAIEKRRDQSPENRPDLIDPNLA